MTTRPVTTPLSEAEQRVRDWKRAGRRIVFTNGCFDLLHPGHISYLQAARELGDALVVGLNDDDSIRRLKGPSRPINPLDDRACMLSALKPVDMVVPFSEETPLKLITALMPDILVKGGDYTPESIVGADVVRASGGEVVVLHFKDGHSTTSLIARIKANTKEAGA